MMNGNNNNALVLRNGLLLFLSSCLPFFDLTLSLGHCYNLARSYTRPIVRRASEARRAKENDAPAVGQNATATVKRGGMATTREGLFGDLLELE